MEIAVGKVEEMTITITINGVSTVISTGDPVAMEKAIKVLVEAAFKQPPLVFQPCATPWTPTTPQPYTTSGGYITCSEPITMCAGDTYTATAAVTFNSKPLNP